MPALSPEAAVKKLSRLPSNCECPNCGTTCKYGFSTVCIKYYTFVCNMCKSSHQAVSHRCKSLTMSSWDAGEVLKLKTQGNDYARRVWLGSAPAVGTGGRPREGDDINVFKRFVVEAYERRRYYVEPTSTEGGGDGPAVQSAPRAPAPAASTGAPSRGFAPPPPSAPAASLNVPAGNNYWGAAPAPAPPPRMGRPAAAPAPPPAPAPAVDLLDFGAFDSAATAPTTSQAHVAVVATTPAPTTTTTSTDPFDPFNNAAPSSSPSTKASEDLFGSVPSSVAAPVSAGIVGGNDASFDPFGGFNNGGGVQQQEQQSTARKTPIMNSSSSNMMGWGGVGGGGGMMSSMTMNGGGGMMAMSNSMPSAYGNNAMMGGMSGMGGGGAMNGMNGGMMNGMMAGMSISSGMGSGAMQQQPQQFQQQQRQMPTIMNVNVMQPMNNSISSNFGSPTSAAAPSGSSGVAGRKGGASGAKPDPFAGLGF